LPGIEAFKNAGFTARGEITLSWYSHDKSKNYLFDAAVDGKDKDNERILLQVQHAAPSNGKQLCQALLDLNAGKHQVNIRSRCENGPQYFCGEQSATITIVVPAKAAPVVVDSKKAAPVAVQGPSPLTASVASLGVGSASAFVVPPSFGLPFQSAYLQPVSDSLASAELLESKAVLPSKSVFAAATTSVASSPFSSTPMSQSAAAPSWSSSLWSDHSGLKPFQSNMSWTGPVDDKSTNDAILPDDATAKSNLPSFFATDSVVDFCLEGEDDMVDNPGSSLFGFDEELSGTSSVSWSTPAVPAAPSSSFSISGASPWGSAAVTAPVTKPSPVTASVAPTAPPAQGSSTPISPSKTQQQGAAASSTPVQALLALACDATTWSPSDFNEGVRYIFQRLNGHEAASCAMSLRFAQLHCATSCSSNVLIGMSS
jgi:hypothetical protein